ncbi:MAG TPA: YggT family protein [Gammaproteobacteria bacterium]|nr:YggT family protein [Gammaproteobacteria bacterium]
MLQALTFLVRTLADLYLLTFLLRFIMQWSRANYYNPLSQLVFRVTNPLVVPARRVMPSVAGLDVPTLVVLIVLEVIVTFVLLRLAGLSLPIPRLLFYSVLRLLSLGLWFYIGALIIYAVLSWFGQPSRNPMAVLLGELVEPVLRPARRMLPPVGGLDLSVLLVIVLLEAMNIIVASLKAATIASPILPAYLP